MEIIKSIYMSDIINAHENLKYLIREAEDIRYSLSQECAFIYFMNQKDREDIQCTMHEICNLLNKVDDLIGYTEVPIVLDEESVEYYAKRLKEETNNEKNKNE